MDDLFAIQYYSMPESASSRVTKSRPRLSLLSGNWECINSLCFASRTVIVKSNKRGSETEKRFSVYHKKMQSYIFEPNLMFQAELTYFLHILHTLSYTVTKLNASPAALSVPLPCNSHELCSIFSLSLSLSVSGTESISGGRHGGGDSWQTILFS